MKLLGLCGYAGSGKDYVYSTISEAFPKRRVVRYAFADEVRIEAASEVLGALEIDPDTVGPLPGGRLWDWHKPYTEAQRRLLQWWGTEYRRAQDPDYWVNKATARLEQLDLDLDFDDIVVITDLRYENEAEMVRSLGGLVVWVTAPRGVRAERLGGVLPPAHASEVIDFQHDAEVWNATRPYLDDILLRYLDLNPRCFRCKELQYHPFHDGGATNPHA